MPTQQNYIDGYPGDAVAISQAPRQYPLRKYGNTTHAVYTRKYQQALSAFTPSPIGMEDPLAAGFYLTEESTPDIDQGIMAEFTRTFANVPLPTVTYSSGSFTRPDLLSGRVSSTTSFYYGSEASGIYGYATRASQTIDAFECYTARTVVGDAGASNAPTGGTFTITISDLGTTSAIAYNASAATMQTAVRATAGYDATYHNLRVYANTSGFLELPFELSMEHVAPVLTAVGGAGMSVSGLSYETTPVSNMPTVSWTPGNDWGVGDGTKTQAELEALGYVLLLPPQGPITIQTDPNTSRNVYINLPTWDIRALGTLNNYNQAVVARNASIRIAGYSTTVDVKLPTDLRNSTQVNAFGAAFAAAWNTAQGLTGSTLGVGYPIDESSSNWWSATIGSPAMYAAGLQVVFNGGYDKTDNNLPAVITQANAPGGWSCTFGWGAVTATINASTTKATLQTAMNALAPVSSNKVRLTIDSLTQTAYGVSLTYSIANKSVTFTSSLTPAPSSITVNPTSPNATTWHEFGLFANAQGRTLTFNIPHGLTGTETLYVKYGSTYTTGAFPFTVTSPTTITVSNSSAPWGNAISEVGKFITSYTKGAISATVRESVSYYRIAEGGDYSDPSQIPLTTASISDKQYFDSLFSGVSSWAASDPSQIEEYLPGIWKRIDKQMKI